MATSKHQEDPRMKCIMADGGGDRATYEVPGYPDMLIEYDQYEEYPWTPVPLVNGRQISGIFYCYEFSFDAVEAVKAMFDPPTRRH